MAKKQLENIVFSMTSRDIPKILVTTKKKVSTIRTIIKVARLRICIIDFLTAKHPFIFLLLMLLYKLFMEIFSDFQYLQIF